MLFRTWFMDPDYMTPGLFTDPDTCAASLQPAPGSSDSSSTPVTGNSSSNAAGDAALQTEDVPGWMAWIGELGLGLPLLTGMDITGPSLTFCYWHLNWGRILLQNVTILGVDNDWATYAYKRTMTVPTTGTVGDPAITYAAHVELLLQHCTSACCWRSCSMPEWK
jgi:hypothetical protein